VSASGLQPKLSVIIPFYNSHKTLPKLLDSLEKADLTDCEVIFVDDCSTDDSAEMIMNRRYRIIKMPKNSGPAAARNFGVGRAKASNVAFVDSDVVVYSQDAFQALIGILASEPGTTSVSTLSDPEPENEGFLPRYTALIEFLSYSRFVSSRREIVPWPDFSTRFGAIRKEAFAAAGGFDERFPVASVEDGDLFYKLCDNGHVGHLLAWVSIGHHWPARFIKLLKGWMMRAYLWSQIFMDRKQFDEVFTTKFEARRKAFDCLIPMLAVICPVLPWFCWIAGGAEMIALAMKYDIAAAFYKRYGISACIRALFMHQIQSVALGAGAFAGLLKRIARQKR
jgi:glycosyltransferase involved in cell wall biosynthesis